MVSRDFLFDVLICRFLGTKKAWGLFAYHIAEALDCLYPMISNSPTPIKNRHGAFVAIILDT